MTKRFPKLSEKQLVPSWGVAEDVKREPNGKGFSEFGLIHSDNDPSDLSILTFIDAAFCAAMQKDIEGIYPKDIAVKQGRGELTFQEYLLGLTEMGLDVIQIQGDADHRRLSYLESVKKGEIDAAAFLKLIETEWAVTDAQIGEYLNSSSIYQFLELLLVRADASRARLNAVKRHRISNAARAYVTDQWLTDRAYFKNNKSAFARAYVQRVKTTFDIVVTEKTIREVWLSDSPAASTQAG